MSTIKDVASLANVSVTTVSRILNNRGYISEDTRNKVKEAMEQLDYYPNQIARSLHDNQSFILGLIVPDSNNPFFAEIIKYVELYASQRGYKILLCNSLNQIEKEENFLNLLKQNQLDGIILCSQTIDVDIYTRSSLPIISFDRVISKDYPYVTCDNYLGGELATKHLIEAGCKRLLHICGDLNKNLLADKRTDAFRDISMKYNVEQLVVEGKDANLLFDNAISFIEKEVLHLLPEFDGVFCSSDILAYALYVMATNNGIKVPEQLKIVGYDYNSFIRLLRKPQITTISQPIGIISDILCTTLVDMIENKDYSRTNEIIGVELIKGSTT